MKKGIIGLGLFALAACVFLTGTNAAGDSGNFLTDWMPSDYLWVEAGSMNPDDHGCLTCMGQSVGWKKNLHLENAVGVSGATGSLTAPAAVKNTGIGWLSSTHSLSQDAAKASTYCAWCHGPGDGHAGQEYKFVTDDPTKAKIIKKKKTGVSCVACHPSRYFAALYDYRLANYIPGTDPDPAPGGSDNTKADWEKSWIPRDPENGKQANKLCLTCHGSYHGFTRSTHEGWVKKGDLRCMDCHMAAYSTTSYGLTERYHNMKVSENGPISCSSGHSESISCHSFSKKEFITKIASLMGGHTQKKKNLP